LIGWCLVVATLFIAATGGIRQGAGAFVTGFASAFPSGATRVVAFIRAFGFSSTCDCFANDANDGILSIVISFGAANETE
jgi:hypothetical protein